MSHVSIAKEKVKKLTYRVEKSLYELRYKDSECNVLDEYLYAKLKALCDDETCNKRGLKFPLVRVNDVIYLDSNNDDLYAVLHLLAKEFDIILDYKKIV